MGVPAAVVLALALSGPAAAVTLTEPAMDAGGNPLFGPSGLLGCVYNLNHSPAANWLKPVSPAGGGSWQLPIPPTTSALPWFYEARCINSFGWGPPATGTLELRLTVP